MLFFDLSLLQRFFQPVEKGMPLYQCFIRISCPDDLIAVLNKSFLKKFQVLDRIPFDVLGLTAPVLQTGTVPS